VRRIARDYDGPSEHRVVDFECQGALRRRIGGAGQRVSLCRDGFIEYREPPTHAVLVAAPRP